MEAILRYVRLARTGTAIRRSLCDTCPPGVLCFSEVLTVTPWTLGTSDALRRVTKVFEIFVQVRRLKGGVRPLGSRVYFFL